MSRKASAWTALKHAAYASFRTMPPASSKISGQTLTRLWGRWFRRLQQRRRRRHAAVGWAIGVERVLELLKDANLLPSIEGPDVFAVVPSSRDIEKVMQVIQKLRVKGVSVQMHSPSASGNPGSAKPIDADADSRGSMKSQFKHADASGAKFALIFGEDELSNGLVTIKTLRDGVGLQRVEALSNVYDWASSLKS